jgi:toxin ParE1/3/4
MPKGITITFADSAVGDLEAIKSYYAEQNIPPVGQRLLAEIITQIELLKDQPDMGRMIPEFELKFLRGLILPPFRIVYRRDKNRVGIVRAWRKVAEAFLSQPLKGHPTARHGKNGRHADP